MSSILSRSRLETISKRIFWCKLFYSEFIATQHIPCCIKNFVGTMNTFAFALVALCVAVAVAGACQVFLETLRLLYPHRTLHYVALRFLRRQTYVPRQVSLKNMQPPNPYRLAWLNRCQLASSHGCRCCAGDVCHYD